MRVSLLPTRLTPIRSTITRIATRSCFCCGGEALRFFDERNVVTWSNAIFFRTHVPDYITRFYGLRVLRCLAFHYGVGSRCGRRTRRQATTKKYKTNEPHLRSFFFGVGVLLGLEQTPHVPPSLEQYLQ